MSIRRRALRASVLALNLLAILPVALYFIADQRLDRVNAVTDYDRRAADGPGQDWLLVECAAGFDTPRHPVSPATTGPDPECRISAVLLLHIPRNNGRPTLIGLPLNGYVPVRGNENVRTTPTAAFALGGLRGLVACVEEESGVRVDRFLRFTAPARGPVPRVDRADVHAAEAHAAESAAALIEKLPPVTDLLDPMLNPMRGLGPSRGRYSIPGSAPVVSVDDADHLHHLIRLTLAVAKVRDGDVAVTVIPVRKYLFVGGLGTVAQLDEAKRRAIAAIIGRDDPLPPALLIEQGG